MNKIVILLAFLMFFSFNVDAQRNKRSKKKVAKTSQTVNNTTKETTKVPKVDPEELFFSANKYLGGIGVTEDKAKAVELFKQAAELGHKQAKIELAGIEICQQALLKLDEKDAQGAFQILASACQEGSFYANRLEAMGYDRGLFDFEGKRNKKYKLGSGLLGGLASAVVNSHVNGKAAKEQHGLANACYRKAAEIGDLYSQKKVGFCYLNGEKDFYTQDFTKAATLLEGPAKAGDADALYALGVLYYSGKGVTENKEKGVQMMRQAADFGNEEAKKKLIELGL